MRPMLAVPVHVDVDREASRNPPAPSPHPIGALAVVAVGGALGAVARYGASVAWPHRPGTFDWATLVVNISGCLLIGVLMVLVTRVFTARRLLRPFLGVGVLGGYTTFSTSVVDVHQAVAAGHVATGLGYLASTVAGAMLAVWAGTAAATWLLAVGARKAGGRRWP